MAKYLKNVAGVITEGSTVATSAGAGDADKIPALDGSGRLDNSFMPAGIGVTSKVIVASEALAAGDLVNIYSNAGTLNVRKADASGGAAKRAHGFVTASVLLSGNATVYFNGINTAQSGLTIGVDAYLSGTTPGRATATAPSTAAHIVQNVGIAASTTELEVNLMQPIVLA